MHQGVDADAVRLCSLLRPNENARRTDGGRSACSRNRCIQSLLACRIVAPQSSTPDRYSVILSKYFLGSRRETKNRSDVPEQDERLPLVAGQTIPPADSACLWPRRSALAK